MKTIVLIFLLTVFCFSQDLKPPKILKVYLSEKLLVTFNEPMDSTVLNKDSYFISPVFGLQPDPIEIYSVEGVNNNLDSIILFISFKVDPGFYRVIVSGVFDTSGNLINVTKNFAVYKK